MTEAESSHSYFTSITRSPDKRGSIYLLSFTCTPFLCRFIKQKDLVDMAPQLPRHVHSQAHNIITACIIGPIVASIFVFIRVWTRLSITHNIGKDDYAALITLISCICFSIVLGISTHYGMGLHRWDVRSFSKILSGSQCLVSRLSFACHLFDLATTSFLK